MVSHNLKLLSKLDGLVKGFLFLLGSCLLLNLGGSAFDGLLELHKAMLIRIQFHILPGLDEGRDQLTACLAH